MAAHESACTTKLYDRRSDQVTLDQVERIVLCTAPLPTWIKLARMPEQFPCLGLSMELTKAILVSRVLEVRGDAYLLRGALAQLHIPETLQDSLMARLDRAPRLREVAQLGAVLGASLPMT
jgi:hypothetical protein